MSYSRLTRKLRAVVWQARECPLTDEIHQLVDNASSDKHASILTFLLYFSQQSSDLIAHLIDNAPVQAGTIDGGVRQTNGRAGARFVIQVPLVAWKCIRSWRTCAKRPPKPAHFRGIYRIPQPNWTWNPLGIPRALLGTVWDRDFNF